MRPRIVFLCDACGRLDATSVGPHGRCLACGRSAARATEVQDADGLAERLALGRAPGAGPTGRTRIPAAEAEERAREKLRALTTWRDAAFGEDPSRQ